MSKVKNPFLSFSARKTIGKTLTAQDYVRIDRIISKPTPTDPQSPDQLEQRSFYDFAVPFWQACLATADTKPPWNRYARFAKKPMAGYHQAIRSMTRMQAITPNPSYSVFASPTDNFALEFLLLNIQDFAIGTEVGDFQIRMGTVPTNLLVADTKAIDSGCIVTDQLASVDTPVYYQLWKDNFPRSGLHRTTLEANPMAADLTVNNLHVNGDATLDGSAQGFNSYVDRGRKTSPDFTKPDFVTDGASNLIDLSAIVPAGAQRVDLIISFQFNLTDRVFRLWSPDYGLNNNEIRLRNHVANTETFGWGMVPTNAAREVQYRISVGVYAVVTMTVKGWTI